MKTIKTTSTPLRNTDFIKIAAVKEKLKMFITTRPRTVNELSTLFGVDVSTIRATDCVYRYILEELIMENSIEQFKNKNIIIYRKPQLTLF